MRVRALLKVVRARAFAEVPNVDLTSATPQTFVMLRLSASHEWSCFAFRHFWYNHCMTKRYADVRFSTELTAEDFHAIGATYGLPYGGTFKHCHGDVANFASVLTDFPQYPFDIPARLRPTYWKLPRDCGAEDLIPASLDAMILSVVYCIHGAVPECSPVAWEQHLQSFVRLACDDDLGRPAMLQRLSSFLQHTTAEAWSSLPARLARPVLLSDYHALAARVGYRYCGLSLEPRALQVGLIPPTITSSRCVFLPLASDIAPEPARDDFWEQAWKSSYLRLYLAWQTRVPSFAKVARLVSQLHGHGDATQREGMAAESQKSLLQQIYSEFPSAPHSLVESVFLEVMAARGLRELDDCVSRHLVDWELASLPPVSDAVSVEDTPAADNAFKRVATLRQKELQIGCDTLTHPTPPIKSDLCQRRAAQDVSALMQFGLHVAFRRGLRALLSDYSSALSRFAKHQARQVAVQTGIVGASGEDEDLDSRFEALPLSPLLLAHAPSLARLQDTDVQETLWKHLLRLANSALERLNLQTPGTSTLELTTSPHPYSIIFRDSGTPLCPAVLSPDSLCTHEFLLGFVMLIVQKHSLVPLVRSSTKSPVSSYRRSHLLLSVFSITSFLELTEKWYALPCPPQASPATVSNMHALEVRRLAKFVQEEREQSSKALCPHLCAACGQLLPAPIKEERLHQAGPAYQVLGTPCKGSDMPPFLLLFSKALIGRRLPSVFLYDPSARTLSIRDVTKAPWIHYRRGRGGVLSMCGNNPWYYCSVCYLYWAQQSRRTSQSFLARGGCKEIATLRAAYASATAVKRMPMRNWFEGYFTAWHRDIAYCHLHPSLKRIYPENPTLPPVADVLHWRQRKNQNKVALDSVMGGDDQNKKDVALLEKAKLQAIELEWAPPPGCSVFKTPIPAKYFVAALGTSVKTWRLDLQDLVPVEQTDLMQDAPACLHWSRIRSADARACVSLCRPLGTTVHKRQLPRNAGVLPCMPHQAGKTVHAPLRLEQDVARGMLTGVVAKDSFTKEMFDLRPEEPAALEHVLPWLLNHNPWLGAYSTSLREVHTGLEQLRAEMQSAGRLLPGGFEGVQASDGKPLHEHLDQEVVAQLLPIDPLRSLTGSYQHLRAMATAICTSSLQQQLPPAWQQLQENPINDEGGHSIQPVPAFLGDNKSLTNVSFLDSHVEAKLFVDKFRHGTGSFRSTLDCINLRQHYRRGRMWSLDGEFICEEDPSWIFWQREHEIKMRLWEDWRGKHFGVPKPAASAVAPATFSPPSSVRHEAAYSKAMFSQRVGSLIPDSAQALSRTKFEWLEAARPENLGPPTGMTTFVGHPTAAPIIAHALQGPCANPDPESSVNFLWPGRPKNSSTGHVTR